MSHASRRDTETVLRFFSAAAAISAEGVRGAGGGAFVADAPERQWRLFDSPFQNVTVKVRS